MTRQWSEVRTAITGGTGQAILRALGPGERDPLTRAQRRQPAGPSSAADLARALTGRWRPEPRCMLPPALAVLDCYTHPMAAGEAPSARPCAVMKPRVESDAPPGPFPRVTPGAPSTHPPRDAARASLARLTGVARVAVPGRSASIAHTSSAAVGTAMDTLPPVTPFCAGRGVAPPHAISGGHGWRSRTRNGVSRGPPALRQAAQAVARSASAVGAAFRARRARLGPPQATVATAQQSARVVSHLRPDPQPCTDESAAPDDRTRRARDLQPLRRRAPTRGYT
jgi:transposase